MKYKLLVILIIGLSAISALQADSNNYLGKVTFYDGENYEGLLATYKIWRFGQQIEVLDLEELGWNDKVSSMKVEGHIFADLYELSYGGGENIQIIDNVKQFSTMDNAISSFVIRSAPTKEIWGSEVVSGHVCLFPLPNRRGTPDCWYTPATQNYHHYVVSEDKGSVIFSKPVVRSVTRFGYAPLELEDPLFPEGFTQQILFHDNNAFITYEEVLSDENHTLVIDDLSAKGIYDFSSLEINTVSNTVSSNRIAPYNFLPFHLFF